MSEPGAAEINPTNQVEPEAIKTETQEKPQGLVGRFLTAVRKPFERNRQESITPEAPKKITPEELEAEITRLGAEQKNIVDRSLGDMTIADRRMAEAKSEQIRAVRDRLTQLRASTATAEKHEPVLVAPTEPPAEEQRVA